MHSRQPSIIPGNTGNSAALSVYMCNIYMISCLRRLAGYGENSKKGPKWRSEDEIQARLWFLLLSAPTLAFGLMQMSSALPPAGWDVAALAQSSSSSDVCLISDPELRHPTGWAQGRGSILT